MEGVPPRLPHDLRQLPPTHIQCIQRRRSGNRVRLVCLLLCSPLLPSPSLIFLILTISSLYSLGNPKGGSANNLTITQRIFCQNGLRLQLHFPQCWVLSLSPLLFFKLFSSPFLVYLFPAIIFNKYMYIFI